MKLWIYALILSFLFLVSHINAQEKETTNPESTNSIEATASATVNYNLAFPGILPGHPLYKIKVLRDKVTVALINDPLKKIDFYLLQTDKGILAAAMLVDKNRIDLAKQTALKAEHNYTLLTYELYSLRKKPETEFFKKLKTASFKHQEVLSSLVKRVSKDDQKVFKQVADFSKRNWETVEKYQRSTRSSRF